MLAIALRYSSRTAASLLILALFSLLALPVQAASRPLMSWPPHTLSGSWPVLWWLVWKMSGSTC